MKWKTILMLGIVILVVSLVRADLASDLEALGEDMPIKILNMQSYPIVGDSWITNFQTLGEANLKITTFNGTLFEKDIEFVSLKCGNKIKEPNEVTEEHILYENYYCFSESYFEVKVLTSGKHNLRFEFGDDVAYSYNEAKLKDIKKISWKDNNMTIEFKENEIVIGQATLKSHQTYDEVLKVTSGKNKTVIWYEFFEFKEDYISALKGIEFIDMMKMIENKSYTTQFKDDKFELINESKVLIKNPNYLLPIEKNYSFVYLDKKGNWLPYNSLSIPKGNITIGVQTNLFWSEFIDVRFNIFDNILDKHALVIGTNCGFVTEAPVDDPQGSSWGAMEGTARVSLYTSPATATKIVEVGWWCDEATPTGEMEIGIYAADGEVVPGESGTLLYSETGAKGTTVGWKKVTGLNWAISEETNYWLAVQLDATGDFTDTDRDTTGDGYDAVTAASTLPNPYGGGTYYTSRKYAYYAVWEGAPVDTCSCPASGNWLIQCSDNCDIQACDMQTNNVLINGTGTAQSLRNITNATRIRIQGGCRARW